MLYLWLEYLLMRMFVMITTSEMRVVGKQSHQASSGWSVTVVWSTVNGDTGSNHISSYSFWEMISIQLRKFETLRKLWRWKKLFFQSCFLLTSQMLKKFRSLTKKTIDLWLDLFSKIRALMFLHLRTISVIFRYNSIVIYWSVLTVILTLNELKDFKTLLKLKLTSQNKIKIHF